MSIPEVLLIEPRVFTDARGFFFESFNARRFAELTGLAPAFVQDNHSHSRRGVLRGLHYQIAHPQAKLVRVSAGRAYDVAVDIRRGSPTFGRWVGVELSAENHRQLYVPEGFAHGYLALSETVDFLYKTTDYWFAEHERCIRWDDRDLAVAWPVAEVTPQVNARDAAGVAFRDAEVFEP
jgi:dTDP-4-dehydrorhamnose 3,5-epimerase